MTLIKPFSPENKYTAQNFYIIGCVQTTISVLVYSLLTKSSYDMPWARYFCNMIYGDRTRTEPNRTTLNIAMQCCVKNIFCQLMEFGNPHKYKYVYLKSFYIRQYIISWIVCM